MRLILKFISCKTDKRNRSALKSAGRDTLQNKILLCNKVKPWPRYLQFFREFSDFGILHPPHFICDNTGMKNPEVEDSQKKTFLGYSGQVSTLVESRRLTCKILFQRDTLGHPDCTISEFPIVQPLYGWT